MTAVRTIGLNDPLHIDTVGDAPDVDGAPDYVWVRFAADQAPADGLDYRAALDSEGLPTAVTRGLPVMQPGRVLDEAVVADNIARALAPQLRRLLRPVVVPPDEAFVDQDAGLFDREVYLRLARAGAFPAKTVGKKRVARWGDVKTAFLKKCAPITVAEPTEDPEVDLLNVIRQKAGLAIKGGR